MRNGALIDGGAGRFVNLNGSIHFNYARAENMGGGSWNFIQIR